MDRLTLLPCPFCGGEAELRKRYSALEGEPKHYVRCSSGKCGARYVPDGFPVDEWNRRQSLSQEAVRDEVLEGAARLCENWRYAEHNYTAAGRWYKAGGFMNAIAGATDACATAIRALKREPNAAAQAPLPARLGSDAKVDSRQVESATDASAYPAPAAPDVASMVKRLRECCTMIGYATSGAERASHKRNADAAEAALLAKLGQGWIPVSADNPTRQVAWIDNDARHVGIFVGSNRHLFTLPLPPGASDE